MVLAVDVNGYCNPSQELYSSVISVDVATLLIIQTSSINPSYRPPAPTLGKLPKVKLTDAVVSNATVYVHILVSPTNTSSSVPLYVTRTKYRVHGVISCVVV